jgi:hypothetical protein
MREFFLSWPGVILVATVTGTIGVRGLWQLYRRR